MDMQSSVERNAVALGQKNQDASQDYPFPVSR